jgi:hypothetical protein
MALTLGQKQEIFAGFLPQLITRAYELGFRVRLKELYRPPEMAEIYAKRGTGIANSLHCDSLAIDLVLFRNGRPLWATERYRDLGEYWESLHDLNRWGGSFGDGGHFSLTHGGRA